MLLPIHNQPVRWQVRVARSIHPIAATGESVFLAPVHSQPNAALGTVGSFTWLVRNAELVHPSGESKARTPLTALAGKSGACSVPCPVIMRVVSFATPSGNSSILSPTWRNIRNSLRGSSRCRIRQRDGNRLEVDQIVRFKGMHARFTTYAVFDPPRRIDVVSHDTLFKNFDQKWEFLPVDDHGTMVEYESTMEMRSSLLQHAMQALFDEPQIARKTLDAFVRRAQQVYGKR